MPEKDIKFSKTILIISGILIFFAGGIIATLISPLGYHTQSTGQIDGPGGEENKVSHVHVQNPIRQTIHRSILLPGDILPWQQATLFSKVSGYLEEIQFDKGDWVKEGDVIARIAVPELENELEKKQAELTQCDAEVVRAQAEFKLRKTIHNRLVKVQAESKDMVSQEQVDEAEGNLEVARAELALAKSRTDVALSKIERTKTFLNYALIKAPFSGVITNRWVDPGALIQVATTSQEEKASLVHLMDMNTIRVQVHVPEPDTPFIKMGKRARLTIDELPGKVFESDISRFSWALARGTRTMLVEIDFTNDRHFLRPGMFAKVNIELEAHDNAMTILAEALIMEKKKKYVYIVKEDKVKKVLVKTGFDDGIIVEILDGLNVDDKVIIAGKQMVSEGEVVIASELKGS
ncbi:MAG: putative transporter protein [Candidatus Scalindua rubra]|uniref:Putative transporter protein n=1 Tax=Candidatus Scalindua rubra TaxID=1872076 RepID=A0A1E3X8I6_9BACT|nr:MAG: putative transporter protein [Candidatus Scalindua rubra]